MQDDEMAIEVVVPVEEKEIDSVALGKTLWNEITGGVGIWGAFRPVFAVALSLVFLIFNFCIAYSLTPLEKRIRS